MNARGSFIKVEKDGYFLGSRRFFPKKNVRNHIRIQLLSQNFNQNFETSSGGNISLANNASIQFEPNSIATKTGEPYSGTVLVAAKWLDPSLLKTLDQMPGNLQGLSILNEEVALGTYGMIAVELERSTGESLNIADEFTATLTMSIQNYLQGNAPSELPFH